ncbi:MAG: tRNA (adenosine(37)-N6)-threonylcarbamoyltransferase complex dimerization subunit type 1 TsaB [Pseudobacteriovorax sp.]|nr:tRNA (adenosine(37)-N6)-threonylcarbamoyltransferase complex dimerization subunit type 1 TsaB [Pseudobacteriovorax sp.]
MKEYVIYLDTSLKGACVALYSSDSTSQVCIAQHSYFSNNIAAGHLTSLIDRLLSSHDLTLRAINSLVVNIGPGSFTGIKVGISFAQGLQLAIPSLRLIGVSGLKALAESTENSLWFMKATKNQGYAFAVAKGFGSDILPIDCSNQILKFGRVDRSQWSPFEYDSKIESYNVIGDWNELKVSLSDPRISLKTYSYPIASASLSESSMDSYREIQTKTHSEGLAPVYVRMSAPEELAAGKR